MDIRDRILARPDLYGARKARDLDALAAGLNAQPPMTIQSRFITTRGVMASCVDGNAILDTLEAVAPLNSAVRRALKFLDQQAGLDIGDPYTQKMIDSLAAQAVLTQSQADQLKALALAPQMVTRDDIATAMYNPDGTEK